ncbi:MAG: MFS transporter [Chloroflexi bacterium]|nr:MFS transporter [Chloroflexota bacterium]
MRVASLRAVAGEIEPAPLWNSSFISLWLVWFLFGFCTAPTQPLLPVYVDGVLHRPPLFTSLLSILYLVTGAIGAIIGGRVADSVGRKPTLLIGSLSGLFAGGIFLTHSVFFLIVLSLTAGFLQSIQSIGGQTYLMGAVRQSHLGTASALFFIGSTLGTSLGNGAAGPLLDHTSWNLLAIAIVATTLVVIAGAWLGLPKISVSTAQAVHAVNQHAGYLAIATRPEILLLLGIRLFPTFYWGMATLLLPLLLFRITHDPSTAATFSALSLSLAACCQLGTGRLADRIGRRKPAAVLTALIATISLITAGSTHALLPLFIAGTLGACSAWSLSVLMPGLIKELSHTGEEGRTLALTHFGWNSAKLTGALVGGSLVSLNSGMPFVIAGLLNALGCLMAILLLQRQQ